MTRALTRTRTALHGLGALVRRIIGAPDYELYLSHVRRRHPEATPLTREAFDRDALARRYDRAGSRCC